MTSKDNLSTWRTGFSPPTMWAPWWSSGCQACRWASSSAEPSCQPGIVFFFLNQKSLDPRITCSLLCKFVLSGVVCCPPPFPQQQPWALCSVPGESEARLRQQSQEFVRKSCQAENSSWLAPHTIPYHFWLFALVISHWTLFEWWFLTSQLGIGKSRWLKNVNCVLWGCTNTSLSSSPVFTYSVPLVILKVSGSSLPFNWFRNQAIAKSPVTPKNLYTFRQGVKLCNKEIILHKWSKVSLAEVWGSRVLINSKLLHQL